MPIDARLRPLVFGEVLFDVFDDGREVLGGAPFNVAWHLRGFGLDPVFLGRVGSDPRGEAIRDRMTGWGLDVSGLQEDLVHATGVVRAHVESGSPSYEILEDRAWDYVDGDHAAAAARWNEISFLYHGTLALRGERTRRAFERVRDATEARVLCDVNLRPPWTPLERVREALSGAHVAKLNDDELGQLTESDCHSATACSEMAHRLRERHDLDLVVVTRGERGALAVTADDEHAVDAVEPDRIVDTIGAGDAFASVLLVGLHREWPLPVVLRRAAAFAASICAIRGATPDEPHLHESHRERWAAERDEPDAQR